MNTAPKEKLLYADVVGARVGRDYMNAGSFTGFISVYKNKILLKGMLFRKYVFEPGDIQGVEPYYVYGKKIHLLHNVDEHPQFIAFSAHKNVQEWIVILNQAGFDFPAMKGE